MKGIFVVQRELKINIHLEEEFVQMNLIFILYSLLFGEEMCYMIYPIVMFWLIKSCLFLFEFIESIEIRVIYFPINLFMNECKIII